MNGIVLAEENRRLKAELEELRRKKEVSKRSWGRSVRRGNGRSFSRPPINVKAKVKPLHRPRITKEFNAH